MPSVEDIEKELLTLIQDEGLSTQRMALYGRSIMEVAAAASPQDAVDWVVAAIEDVDGDINLALAYAFGIDRTVNERDNLSQRRAELIERDDFPDISEATLRRWERKGITMIAQAIYQRRLHIEEQASEEVDDMDMVTVAKVQLVRLQRIRKSLDEQTGLLREIRDLLKANGQQPTP